MFADVFWWVAAVIFFGVIGMLCLTAFVYDILDRMEAEEARHHHEMRRLMEPPPPSNAQTRRSQTVTEAELEWQQIARMAQRYYQERR